ncbi:MAG: hypothetical protein AB1345_01370 [Chloroflexota bacterium]
MQQEVHRLLREAQADGTTVFFSSHIISEVETLAERVAIIRQGVIVEEAQPKQLIDMTLRRVHIRFKQPVNVQSLTSLGGVSLLTQSTDTNITIQVEGEMDNLIKALAAFPVSDLEIERPSLEETFLAYYEVSDKEAS